MPSDGASRGEMGWTFIFLFETQPCRLYHQLLYQKSQHQQHSLATLTSHPSDQNLDQPPIKTSFLQPPKLSPPHCTLGINFKTLSILQLATPKTHISKCLTSKNSPHPHSQNPPRPQSAPKEYGSKTVENSTSIATPPTSQLPISN